MPHYPSSDRAAAARALHAALRDVADANERLQLAAAMVAEAYGDSTGAETIRMLPIGPARPGKPPVPAPADVDPPTRVLSGLVNATDVDVVVPDEQPHDQCDQCAHDRHDHGHTGDQLFPEGCRRCSCPAFVPAVLGL